MRERRERRWEEEDVGTDWRCPSKLLVLLLWKRAARVKIEVCGVDANGDGRRRYLLAWAFHLVRVHYHRAFIASEWPGCSARCLSGSSLPPKLLIVSLVP